VLIYGAGRCEPDPVIGIQVIALVLLFNFPAIATWLPDVIGW